MRIAAALFLLSVVASPAMGDAARVELPIRQTALPDGELRYSISVKIGTTDVDAMLDTGSTGLRVLPGTLQAADFTPGDREDHYSYGSGARYNGVIAHAVLSAGGVSGEVSFQDIRTVDCVEKQPHCPATRMAAADYGIGGSGIPKQGFRAIFGVLFAEAEVDNPLMGLGVARWIVILPRPGDSAPGSLILNPGDDEIEGYTMFRLPMPKVGSAIPGCLLNENTQARICGRILFDSGANGTLVESHAAIDGYPWPAGTIAAMVLLDENGHKGGTSFAVGPEPYAKMAIDPTSDLPFNRISGAVPYFGLAVLYDARQGEIGIKPR